MSRSMSHLDPPIQTILPATIHNDNDREAAENFHQHIRHGISEGRATPLLIGAYSAAMIFFVCLVLYGINNQRNEMEETSTPPAAAQNIGAAPQAQQPQPSTPAPKQ